MVDTRPRLVTPAFVLLFAITFVTFFAAFQLFPTVPLRLRAFGADLAESGRFMTIFTLGSASGALFTGSLGDLTGQRRMMMACALLFAGFLGAYSQLSHRAGFYWLAFPHGVVWSGLLTASMTVLGRLLPPQRRTEGLALFGLASPGGAMLGPMVALSMMQHLGFSRSIQFSALCFIVLGLLAFSLPPDLSHPPHQPKRALQKPDQVMLAPCLVLFMTALGYGALSTYTPQEGLVLLFQPLGHLSTAATFLTCMSIGMMALRVVIGKTGLGAEPVRLLPTVLTVAFVGLLLLALLPGGVWRHAISGIIYGCSYSLVHTLVNTHVLDTIPEACRGSAFGATLFSFDAGIGLSSALIGYVLGRSCHHYGPFGYRLGWLTAAIATGLAIPLSQKMLRRLP